MTQENYTSHDMELAEKIGGMTASVQHLHDKFDRVIIDKEAMWNKIDSHTVQLNDHAINIVKVDEKINARTKAVGVFVLGFQAAMFILEWLKKN